MNWLYLAIDIGCIIIPLLFSFYRKTYFFKEWKWFFPANFLVLIIFLIWDEFFTKIGVWGFNPKYISGIYLSHLPLEEVLFFICIPYACTFTYFCIKQFFSLEKYERFARIFFTILAIILFILGVLNSGKYYTFFTFTFLSFCILLLIIFEKKKYLSYFFFTFLIILFPFFLSNGILTGSFIPEEVVWYNNQENLGIRMFTIPIEDTFYGMLLLLLNVSVYENVKSFFIKKAPPKQC